MSLAETARRAAGGGLAGRWAALRADWFPTPGAAAATLLVGAVAALCLARAFDWAVLSAVWTAGTPADCEAAQGACWAFLREKWQVILLGAYPRDEIWRPLAGVGFEAAALGLLAGLGWPRRLTAPLLLAAFVVLVALLDGRPLGLAQVDMVRWHGIAVIALLGVFCLFAAWPLGVLLALARVDGPPVVSAAATALVSTARAAPMVTVLFFGVFVLPLLLPPGVRYPPLPAAFLALVVFHAAYFAEVLRGGLQAIPAGQREAAEALGLGYVARTRKVILPQATAVTIPSLTNTVIGGFKDTSLVAIVGIFDLLKTTQMAYGDPAWQRYALEGLTAAGLFYFVSCWAISRHSRTLERRLAGWLTAGR